jgi:hypothetical protein
MKNALLCAAGFLLAAITSAHAVCFPVFGTNGDDTMVCANCGDCKLIGLGGNDSLTGLDGNDVLYPDSCGASDDPKDCKNGQDTMTGGLGKDAFLFNNKGESRGDHIDTITDFTPGDDVIAMAGVLYHANQVTGSFIGTAPFDGTPGEVNYRVVYLPRSHTPAHKSGQAETIISADLDGDLQPDFEVYLIGSIALTANDFLFDSYPP